MTRKIVNLLGLGFINSHDDSDSLALLVDDKQPVILCFYYYPKDGKNRGKRYFK